MSRDRDRMTRKIDALEQWRAGKIDITQLNEVRHPGLNAAMDRYAAELDRDHKSWRHPFKRSIDHVAMADPQTEK
jgi:hypothetical protein